MIINEWDNFIVTDNVLTNLPISQLSSIPRSEGVGSGDLLLVSKPSDGADTGYMSYKTSFGSLSSWMYDAFGIFNLSNTLSGVYESVDLFRNGFYDILCKISAAIPSVVVDICDSQGNFNPHVISAIYSDVGVISSLGGYRLADAMSNIFDWKRFNNGVFTNLTATSKLTAANLTSTKANITNLSVGGQPYQHLSVMTQAAYDSTTTKSANCFYFTYQS